MADNPGFISDEAAQSARTCPETGSNSKSSSRAAQNPRLRWWSHVTVEPLVACYYISFSLTHLAAQNMLLQKACWPGKDGPPLNATCPDENSAQITVAEINTWKPIIQFSMPFIFALLAGSWSDNHGGRRKPLLLIPVAGEMMTDLALTLNAVFWQWSPTAAALSEALPSALGGGRGTLSIGVTSYIADLTSHKTRTVRLGIVTALVYVGAPIGTALGGMLNRHVGFVGVFVISALLNLLGIVYTAFLVRETGTVGTTAKSGKCCDASAVVQSVVTVCKPRDGYRRCCLLILSLATLFVLGPFMGEFSILYLFVRVKFGWNEEEYGYYSAYKMTILLFGTLLSMGLLSHYLKFSDAMIGILSSIMQMVASLMYVFVNVGWLMYVVPLTELLHGAAFAVQRSIISKQVSSSEMGQTNAILGVTEAIVPLIVFPLYNKLYQETIDVLPGAFYLLGSALSLPAVVIFSVVYILTKRQAKKENKLQEDSSYTDTTQSEYKT